MMTGDAINRMLEQRVKELAAQPPVRSRDERLRDLALSLGLFPEPPRTALNGQVTGTIVRAGYRIEKVRFESRPGVLVVAHLYLPEGEGPYPCVLRPHGHWAFKKSSPVVQASAIGLALSGFAVMVVESPGWSFDDNPQNERRGMGSHDDPYLAMGSPVHGVYVWDLVRAIDYLESRADIAIGRLGITGESGGGTATMYAFAFEHRIRAAVPVCAMSSLEVNPHNGCLCNHVPGALRLGDRADIVAIRATDAALMVIAAEDDPEFPLSGHRRTDEKLRRAFRSAQGEHRYRFEVFPFGHDYNRRMREAAVAFFREHLMGEPAAPYTPEPIPLTDSSANSFPANTVPADESELLVLTEDQRSTRTFRDLLNQALSEPYPQTWVVEERLTMWGRYGKLPAIPVGPFVAFHDAGINAKEPNSLALPIHDVDLRLCIYLGLSKAELLAQIIHLALPGAPSGWEEYGRAGDALTSLVASMKTLTGTGQGSPPPGLAIAEGVVSSFVARMLKRYRPELAIQVSHEFSGWEAALQLEEPAIAQPLARYLAWE